MKKANQEFHTTKYLIWKNIAKTLFTIPEIGFVNREEIGVKLVRTAKKNPVCFKGAHLEQIIPIPAKFAEKASP